MSKKLDLAKLKQTINFYPHPIQRQILSEMGRFTVVASGKRLGKTVMAAYLALRELFYPYHSVWVVAPTHDLTSRVWEYLDQWIDRYFGGDSGLVRVNKHEKIIENNATGAKLWTKSGEAPSSLLGKGLDLVIIDEASRLDNGIWDGYLRPNLMDKNGRAFFISNPFGFNWFYDLYLLGGPESDREKYADYISFKFPTAVEDEQGNVIGTNNPYAVKVEELQAIKATTPPDIWRSEYLAAFQEGAGQLFKRFDRCIDDFTYVTDPNDYFEPPQPGHLYCIGIDIAKVEDFTVICIIDRMTHRVVGFYRTNGMSWELMSARIKRYSEEYNWAMITLDATGNAGDMFTETLSSMGVNVDTQYKYTNKSKIMLIDKLSMFLEGGKIKFPKIPELINELRSFTYNITGSGNLQYGSSKHDDCVNALALACWNLNEEPLGTDNSRNVIRPRLRNMG